MRTQERNLEELNALENFEAKTGIMPKLGNGKQSFSAGATRLLTNSKSKKSK